MFEVGKKYEFVTLSVEDEHGPYNSTETWIVAEIEGNLLHLHMPAQEGVGGLRIQDAAGEVLNDIPAMDIPERNMVLNTASAFFHSATPVPHE
jgi:hypothetical protein